jgi:hypothetical protein
MPALPEHAAAPAPVQVNRPLQYSSIHHLSKMAQLQHLTLWSPWDDRFLRYFTTTSYSAHPILPAQLLSALTGLTRLESNVFDVATLADLCSCVNLQHLAVSMPWEERCYKLGPADWAGLAVLTRLTELRLMNVSMPEASPEACEALGKLTRLQVAAAGWWAEGLLPALTACAQLTELIGALEWSQGGAHAALSLPQVLLVSAPGSLLGPFARFDCLPNLQIMRAGVLADGASYTHEFAMSASELRHLCKHCTGLKELMLTVSDVSLCSLAGHLGNVAAIQSLTSLHHLTCLGFTPSTTRGYVALVQACCVLEGHSLQDLHIR